MNLLYIFILAGLLITGMDGPVAAFEISRFDPVGKVIDRIQTDKSRLNINGFIRNKTDLDLHAKSHDTGRGHIDKDWNFQMIEWNASLELRYKISDHMELINVNNFLYDSIYDWDKNADFSSHVKKKLEYYNSFKEIMRELYLNIIYESWFIKLGKQQVVWGKMDGKCIDIINPSDSRESVNGGQDDYEWRRIPTWMSNITYFWSDYYLQFIWIPDFEPAVKPLKGSVWWYPALSPSNSNNIKKKDKPSTTLKEHEFALRFNIVKGGWDTSFIYFYTWDDTPTLFGRGFRINPMTGISEPCKELKHTRLHQFGFNVDKGSWFLSRNWVWRIEALYTLNDYVSSKETIGSDGVAKRDNLKSISSIETNWFNGELNTLFQFSWKYQFGYKNSFQSLGSRLKRFNPMLLLSFTKQWYSDRLKLTGTVYYRPGEGSWKFKDTLAWAFSDYITAQIRYTGYSGVYDDMYGMYSKWDNLGIEIKYSF